ncbi:PREDICTED: GATA transcription factor 18 [Tarenaya hassleriana]|uniref:GATA transcription factor 18 n=1 Tax=Tarenaya hassleriana TaxID=28532 RepID=UPI00053C6349|nr:PREDICTED: GATA transcription factor 18 [Tarenaya hassleriana]
MMQRYNSSTQGQYCHSCGMFHHQGQSCCYGNNVGSFSMMFSSAQNGGVFENNNNNDSNCGDYYSSSSVDCTLSLGTPSTRLCEEDEKRRRSTSSGGSSCMSNFWDLLHSKHSSKTASFDVPAFSTSNSGKFSRGGGGGGGVGGDPLLARRCANCDTTSTPLWRNGPRGPKSLCNACGIRFKKEERRSTAVNGGSAPVAADHCPSYNYHNATGNGSWVHHSPSQRLPCYQNANEIRFIDDVAGDYHHRDSDAAPFLSWRLNVADRAGSLVHDFTR